MINIHGTPTIQEELGDEIKVYSHPAWLKELERRAVEDAKSKKKAPSKEATPKVATEKPAAKKEAAPKTVSKPSAKKKASSKKTKS